MFVGLWAVQVPEAKSCFGNSPKVVWGKSSRLLATNCYPCLHKASGQGRLVEMAVGCRLVGETGTLENLVLENPVLENPVLVSLALVILVLENRELLPG